MLNCAVAKQLILCTGGAHALGYVQQSYIINAVVDAAPPFLLLCSILTAPRHGDQHHQWRP